MNAPAIRRGRDSDLDRLVTIEDAAFDTDRLSRRSFAHALTSSASALFVAERDGAVVGYALLNFRRNSRKARLFSIARDPGAPAGVGRVLLAAAEREAIARGCLAMRLEVRETNSRAARLYERSGYRRFGRHADYYEDGGAALRLEKDLSGEG
ncbi:MAG: GNAT family N-acetyltransferase [Hyphomicrobiales bacterium]|nr:GNAT family N-acetyltransferase [Hyphomicrobiales bacterium]